MGAARLVLVRTEAQPTPRARNAQAPYASSLELLRTGMEVVAIPADPDEADRVATEISNDSLVAVFALADDVPDAVSRALFARRLDLVGERGLLPFYIISLDSLVPGAAPRRRTIIEVGAGGLRERHALTLLRGGEGPIMLEGETGTGKTETARLIHDRTRPGKPFRVVNCAALPESERESLFRGVRRGRYTGVEESDSVFVSCDGGTVVLDDFQDFPPSHQASLLDLLDPFSTIVRGHRLGDTAQEWQANVQVVVAVNRPLRVLFKVRQLRPDIHFRVRRRTSLPSLTQILRHDRGLPTGAGTSGYLRFMLLQMQERALRLHPAPWEAATDSFLNRWRTAFGLAQDADGVCFASPSVFAEAMPVPVEFGSYAWPGNFRELESFAIALYEGTGRVGRWSASEARTVFEQQVALQAPLEDDVESAAPDDVPPAVSPARLLAIAQLRAVTAEQASVGVAARALGLDPRTLRARLRKIADGHEHVPGWSMDPLNAEERTALRTAAERLVSSAA